MSATNTVIHNFLKWIQGTTNADTAYNDLVDKLDRRVGLSVESMTTDAEPGTPSEGDVYIITGSATGTDWATFNEHDVAAYRDAAWTAEAPMTGQIVHVQDESDAIKVWSGTAWVSISSPTLHKYDATAAPTASDDSGSGYSVGSIWVDVTNDAAYICADSTAAAAVWLRLDDDVPLSKYDATTAPTVNEDSGDGYSVGSWWVDVTNDAAYICLDATAAAAVWQQLGSGTGGGGMSPEFKSSAYTASAGDKVFVDCSSGAVTITLPASPSTGDEVMVLDSSGDAATNNVTVGRNSETIDGTAADFVIDLNYGSCSFAYNGSDWKINPANGVS